MFRRGTTRVIAYRAITIALFSLELLGLLFAPITTRAEEVIGEGCLGSTGLRQVAADFSSTANQDVGDFVKYFNENFKTFTLNEEKHAELKRRADKAHQTLTTYKAHITKLAENHCGQANYETFHGSITTLAKNYNGVVQAYKNADYTGNLQEFSLQLLSYSAIQNDTASANCLTLLGSTANDLKLSENAIHDAEVLEVRAGLTPEEIQARDNTIESARTAWKKGRDDLAKAREQGCDQNAATKAKYNEQAASLQSLFQRLTAAETKLGYDATTFGAQVQQAAANISAICKGACSDEKFKDYPIGLKQVLQSLCCILAGFVKTMADIAKGLAQQLQKAIDTL